MERDAHGRVVGGVPPSRRDSRDDFRGPPRDYRDVGRGGGPGGMGVGKTGGGMGGGGAGGGSGGILGTLACPSSTQWSNTYGLSPQFLDSLGISGLLYNRVFVANVSLIQLSLQLSSIPVHFRHRLRRVFAVKLS